LRELGWAAALAARGGPLAARHHAARALELSRGRATGELARKPPLDQEDAPALGLDSEHVKYTPLTDPPTATESLTGRER